MHGIDANDRQLSLLVPAFDIAWAQLMWRRFPSQREQVHRENLAAAVVDLVLAGKMNEPGAIAVAAIDRINQTWTA